MINEIDSSIARPIRTKREETEITDIINGKVTFIDSSDNKRKIKKYKKIMLINLKT